MAILYRVLEYINYFFIAFVSISLFIQLIFIALVWVKKRHFPKAKKLHRFAIIIPACNEEEVIGTTVEKLLTQQTYPREYFDIFVCADNCKDKTAEVARKAGAYVLERFDDNPEHKRASFPIKYIIDYLLENCKDKYDAIIKLDADNLVNKEYIEKMNDCFDTGVEVARSYEASTNLEKNVWTQASGIYYIRDSRIACHVREKLHLDQMLSGAGLMVSMKLLDEIGGWDAMGFSDDSEFTCRRLLEKRRLRFVTDAVVYEDQPSSLKDTYNRVSRMAYGINKNYFKYGPKLFLNFFKTGRISNIDILLTMQFVFISFIAVCWFVPYYIFYIVINALIAFPDFFGIVSQEAISTMGGAFVPEWITSPYLDVGLNTTVCQENIISLCWMILYVVVVFFAIFTFQSWLAVFLDRKKLNVKVRHLWKGLLMSCMISLLEAIASCVGVFKKPKWKKLKRTTSGEINTDAHVNDK